MTDPIEEFRDAIIAEGLTPPKVIVGDGRIHRFPSNGHAKDDAGWYKLHLDGVPAGAFGCWRSQIKQTWCAGSEAMLTPELRAEREAFLANAQREAEAERQRCYNEAAIKARHIWDAATDAPDDHDYLERKGVKSHGLRCDGERLLVPVIRDRRLRSLQLIDRDGGKLFLEGGEAGGGHFYIGGVSEEQIYIVEGYATGATVHEVTGETVAIAFNAGNLVAVAKAVRAKFSNSEIIVAADDDYRTEGNPGVTKAREAAAAIGGKVVVPEFGDNRPEGATDFNDMAAHLGADRVRDCLGSRASEPPKAKVSEDEWPEPKPLPDGLPPVDAFSSEFLPAKLAPWVDDISSRMQCPPEYVAIPAVTALGMLIGRRIGIKPQAKTDWLEVPNLWGFIVGRPGVLKSPAMNEALRVLRVLESAASQEHEIELVKYNAEKRIFEIRKSAGESKAKEAIKKGATYNFDPGDEPEEPPAKRYLTNDTSYESLGEILVSNPRGVLVVRDELVSLLRVLDRDDQAAARGFYLSAWNGTQPYTFDRILRGHRHIEGACVSLLGTTQPGRIGEYVRRVHDGGSGDDGLLQRFGLGVWPDEPPTWRNLDVSPDSEARTNARDLFTKFDTTEPEVWRTQQDEFDRIPFLRFDEAALGIFVEWRTDLERRLRSGELSPALEGHLAKYRKLVPALALINHLADSSGPLGETAILRACAFAEFLESHARRIYGASSVTERSAAKALLARIRRGDVTEPFTARSIHRHDWSGLTVHHHLQAGIDLLVDLGHVVIQPTQSKPKGGRPTVVYIVNPRTLR
jgi:putative DNA primase/helicase